MTQIIVISDTHEDSIVRLPGKMLELLRQADWVVHCGDFTGSRLVDQLKWISRNFIGVYGNADLGEVRSKLARKVIFEVAGKKIGVMHPYWGGPPWDIEDDITAEFPGVDVILFGHTHEPCKRWAEKVLLLNPGQGYSSLGTPASIAFLEIGSSSLRADIVDVEPPIIP